MRCSPFLLPTLGASFFPFLLLLLLAFLNHTNNNNGGVAGLPLGLWLDDEGGRIVRATCDFLFVMCPDRTCCIIVESRTIEANAPFDLRDRIEAAMGCSAFGTLLSAGYLEMLCDPSVAYDEGMLSVATRVRGLHID